MKNFIKKEKNIISLCKEYKIIESTYSKDLIMKNKIFILFLGILIIQNNNTQAEPGTVDKTYMAQFLPKNPIIVEAGAHVGIDTIEMIKLWPSAKIYAFEPVPNLYMQLKNRTRYYKNIYCFDYALSNNNSYADFYISSGTSDGSSSLLAPEEVLSFHPTVLFNTKIQVPTLTLDQWALNNNIDHIDMLWLDLQGAEPMVLKASPNILKTVKVIYTEVSTIKLYADSELYSEFKLWLEKQGFYIQKEEIPWADGGNVLFVRNR